MTAALHPTPSGLPTPQKQSDPKHFEDGGGGEGAA